jgi:hypothetical protein
MATISEFELFHGVVLTKLLRSKRPISLHMIEARPGERWSAYTVNGEVDLFIKHSTTPSATVRGGEGRSWPFVFGLGQLRQMADSKARGGVYVALVGASRRVKDAERCVCLLTPGEVTELIDLSLKSQQALTVKLIRGKSLRVYSGGKERFKVPQGRLGKWEVPGS